MYETRDPQKVVGVYFANVRRFSKVVSRKFDGLLVYAYVWSVQVILIKWLCVYQILFLYV